MAIIEEPPLAAPEWVLTYGDMMSLLLTFFVMIVAMSELKQDDKFQTVALAMEQKFGRPSETPDFDARLLHRDLLLATRVDAAWLARRNLLGDNNTSGSPVALHTEAHDSVLGVALFAKDSLVMTAEAESMLRKLFENPSLAPGEIELRGVAHTVPTPLHSYRDAYDLAYERTRMVARFLTDDLKVNRQRIRLSCIAVENSAAEHVEIVVRDTTPGRSPAYSAMNTYHSTRR
jgi:chemotaxis protein MotB